MKQLFPPPPPLMMVDTSVQNRRECLEEALAMREPIVQTHQNPFVAPTSYVDNVAIRDQFLKPMNTTQGMHR